jgi:hypothetical protein
MSSHRLVFDVVVLFVPSLLCAQSRLSSPEQRTIEISATEKVRATAQAATIKIGFQNQAATKHAPVLDRDGEFLGLERLTHLARSAIIVKIRLQEMARTRVNKLLEKLR